MGALNSGSSLHKQVIVMDFGGLSYSYLIVKKLKIFVLGKIGVIVMTSITTLEWHLHYRYLVFLCIVEVQIPLHFGVKFVYKHSLLVWETLFNHFQV